MPKGGGGAGRYLRHILIALDQLCNAIAGGWPDETLSSRAHRAQLVGRRWPARIINALFLDAAHCRESYMSERLGRQLPPELRAQP